MSQQPRTQGFLLPRLDGSIQEPLAVFILEDGFNVWDDLTVLDVKVVYNINTGN
jgi:hypothetical protein